MAVLWTLATLVIALVFVFQNGLGFALSFLGTCWLPCFSIGTVKWGILRGDKQQKTGIPIVGFLILGLAYWLSTGVEIHVFDHLIGGFTLWIISGLIGLTVPLGMGEPSLKSN
jgi:hypothetical protein